MRITSGVALLFVVSMTGTVLAEDVSFSVGEKWVYDHEGPRPWRPPTETVYGDRVREIASTSTSNDETTWKVVEKWGTYDGSPTHYTLGADGKAKSMMMGTSRVTITPPMPVMMMGLEQGETLTYDGSLKVYGGEGQFGLSMDMKREADQTIEVPAGTFEDCIYYTGTSTLKITMNGNDLEVVAKHEIWFHASVNGMVKEVYTYDTMNFGDTRIPAFECVSTLKSYTKGDE